MSRYQYVDSESASIAAKLGGFIMEHGALVAVSTVSPIFVTALDVCNCLGNKMWTRTSGDPPGEVALLDVMRLLSSSIFEKTVKKFCGRYGMEMEVLEGRVTGKNVPNLSTPGEFRKGMDFRVIPSGDSSHGVPAISGEFYEIFMDYFTKAQKAAALKDNEERTASLRSADLSPSSAGDAAVTTIVDPKDEKIAALQAEVAALRDQIAHDNAHNAKEDQIQGEGGEEMEIEASPCPHCLEQASAKKAIEKENKALKKRVAELEGLEECPNDNISVDGQQNEPDEMQEGDMEDLSDIAFGKILVEIIRTRDHFFSNKNGSGKESLSFRTGLLLQDMHAGCGVSTEKLSRVIGNVLWMLFGNIGEETYAKLVPSPTTIGRHLDRAHKANIDDLSKFLQSEEVVSVCFSNDLTPKGGQYWDSLVLVVRLKSGKVIEMTLPPSVYQSKKITKQAKHTFDSLHAFFGPALYKISGATSDNAATPEMVEVMKLIDDHAKAQQGAGVNMARQLLPSIPELVIDGGLGGRGHLIYPCSMHTVNLVMVAFWKKLGGEQGLNHPNDFLQLLWCIPYYLDKFWNIYIRMVNRIAPHQTDEEIKVITSQVPFGQQTRWASQGRMAASVLPKMMIVATPGTVEFIRKECRIHDNAAWKKLLSKYRVFGAKDPSLFMLILMYMVNCTPGTESSGDGPTGFARILSFLACPHHRNMLIFMSGMYKKHVDCLALLTAKSSLHDDSTAVSAIALEYWPIVKNIMSWVFDMVYNHEKAVPAWTVELMAAERNQLPTSVPQGDILTVTQNIAKEHFNDKLKGLLVIEGAKSDLFEPIYRYFLGLLLQPGMIPLMLTDLDLGQWAAQGMLFALYMLELGTESTNEYAISLQKQMNTVHEDVITDWEPREDWSRGRSKILPGLTGPAVAYFVQKNLMHISDSDRPNDVADMLHMMLFTTKPLQEELLEVAHGHLATVTPDAGALMKVRWPKMVQAFPLITAVLDARYKHMMITNNFGESNITNYDRLMNGQSQSNETTIRDLFFVLNIKKMMIAASYDLKQQQKEQEAAAQHAEEEDSEEEGAMVVVGNPSKPQPKRPLRSNNEVFYYCMALRNKGDEFEALPAAHVVVKGTKRNRDEAIVAAEVDIEADSNKAPPDQTKVSTDKLIQMVADITKAAETGSNDPVGIPLTVEQAKYKRIKEKAAAIFKRANMSDASPQRIKEKILELEGLPQGTLEYNRRMTVLNKYNKGTVKKNSADQTTLADFLSPFYPE